MSKAIIELRCQRNASKSDDPVKSLMYSGELRLHSDPGDIPWQSLNVPFTDVDLQDVAVQMHYLVRLASFCGTEFCVRMMQKGPNSERPPVAMDLDPAQVNKIYESIESAREFFAPQVVTRQINLTR